MSMFSDPSIVPESLRGAPLEEGEAHRVSIISEHVVDLGALAIMEPKPSVVSADPQREQSLSGSLI